MMTNLNRLAYCGLYCKGCRNYKENHNCQGCRDEQELIDDCPTRSCAMSKGLNHCGECGDFPCESLNNFYNDGVASHKLAYENMLRLIEIGIEKFIEEQENKCTCSCGEKRLWFKTECNHETK